jgi:integrase
VAEAIEPHYRALVLISAWCGLRWGEVTELRRKDIGKDALVLTVSRGATHQEGYKIYAPG